MINGIRNRVYLLISGIFIFQADVLEALAGAIFMFRTSYQMANGQHRKILGQALIQLVMINLHLFMPIIKLCSFLPMEELVMVEQIFIMQPKALKVIGAYRKILATR